MKKPVHTFTPCMRASQAGTMQHLSSFKAPHHVGRLPHACGQCPCIGRQAWRPAQQRAGLLQLPACASTQGSALCGCQAGSQASQHQAQRSCSCQGPCCTPSVSQGVGNCKARDSPACQGASNRKTLRVLVQRGKDFTRRLWIHPPCTPCPRLHRGTHRAQTTGQR